MTAANGLEASLLLCDWAEAINGKVYAQGMGWIGLPPDSPISFAVAVIVYVPYDQTNQQHALELTLVTEDGDPFPSEEPVSASLEFEVGRPAGMRKGEQQTMPFALNIQGLGFPVGGYAFSLRIDGEVIATAPFVARPR